MQHEIQIVEEICNIISLTVPQHVDIPLLLAKYRISPRLFNKVFKKHLGRTPAQHISIIRMEYARICIDKGYQIKTVALELGYSNTTNFSRAYKRIFGSLPSKPNQS